MKRSSSGGKYSHTRPRRWLNTDQGYVTKAEPVTITRIDGSTEVRPALSAVEYRRAVKRRERIDDKRRSRILTRDRGTCRYCGAPADELDHIVPVAQGGSSADHNLTAACKECNARKGNTTWTPHPPTR